MIINSNKNKNYRCDIKKGINNYRFYIIFFIFIILFTYFLLNSIIILLLKFVLTLPHPFHHLYMLPHLIINCVPRRMRNSHSI